MSRRKDQINQFTDISPETLRGFGQQPNMLVRFFNFLEDVLCIITRQGRDPMIPNHRRK